MIKIPTEGRGLYQITELVNSRLPHDFTGLTHLFVRHTSCSLVIQENADPTARQDLEEFFDRLAPDGQSWHSHTLEGSDDSPSHMRSAVTNTELLIPAHSGSLSLGRWQGVFLFEHRLEGHQREIVMTLVLGQQL